MNPLLDTVEHDIFQVREIGEGSWFTVGINEKKYIAHCIASPHMDYRKLYSKSKVEALLAECRKQAKREAFLEAADEAYSMSHFDCADELRRMAEGEK